MKCERVTFIIYVRKCTEFIREAEFIRETYQCLTSTEDRQISCLGD